MAVADQVRWEAMLEITTVELASVADFEVDLTEMQ